VKKTSIYIDTDTDIALTRRAVREGTTRASLIRRALNEAAKDSLPVKPRARGVFKGPAGLAQNADDYLHESDFGKT
jgi:hypothetical protein